MGDGGRVVERRAFGRGTGVRNHLRRFETWTNSFTPLCPCLLEETLKAVVPFFLVSMPGEVKDQTCCGLSAPQRADDLDLQTHYTTSQFNYDQL